MLANEFPERAFSTQYALKDLRYAIELASASGLQLSGAANVEQLMLKAIENGDGDKYFPVIIDSVR
jgi:3-hydroxyisobutyrate dehydrogenase-like beta-hydroxyacid dehydrogenase